MASTEAVTQVRVANLCCALEADLVNDVLKPQPGVRRIVVNTVTKIATVEHDSEQISAVDICNLLNGKLLGASLVHTGIEGEASEGTLIRRMRRQALLECLVIALQIGSICWGSLIPLIIGFCLSYSLFLSAGRALAMKKFTDVSVLMLLAAVGAVINMQWTEAVLVGTIVNASGLIQTYMGLRVTASLAEASVSTESSVAILADSRKMVEVNDLQVGDRILIRTGDSIPADGVVIDGNASVDESRLTGESIPVYKTKGSKVFSGTLIVKGALPIVEVTARVGRTQKVTDLIQEAAGQHTPLQDTVETFANRHPVSPDGALLLVPRAWGVIVLVAACPCSIVMAAPVAYMTAIVTCLRRFCGTVIKSPSVIESLAKLELGGLRQNWHVDTGALGEKGVLRLAAAVESLSPHPLASAVVNYYTGCTASYVGGSSSLPSVENYKTLDGNVGVGGSVDGKEILIGGPAMLESLRIEAEGVAEGSAATIFVVIDGQVALSLQLQDCIRPGAVEALRGLGKPTFMLTGDRASVARDVAAELGVDDYKADLRPGDKLEFIRDYQSADPKTLPLAHPKMGARISHPVMMVGDGLNDGPALALAAVGVSFASPCKAVSEKAADIIITDPNRGLFLLGQIMQLGARVRNVVRENLGIAMFTKIVVVAVGAAGYIPLWASVLSDGLCLLLVMANGARPLDWKPTNKAIMDKFAEEATAVRSAAVTTAPTKQTACSPGCRKPCCSKVEVCKKQCCSGAKTAASEEPCKKQCCSGAKTGASEEPCKKQCCSGAKTAASEEPCKKQCCSSPMVASSPQACGGAAAAATADSACGSAADQGCCAAAKRG
ncbi:Copper-transporting ATPase [Perkinsus olseni]|uniref:Copper-transporting ATPase n=2 Tax=Perkinsus olseni TaxID=32597 RepID=A0A7J6NQN8_PEROL|nr:Copper-transporting ATPase [Perkinsus olseni]